MRDATLTASERQSYERLSRYRSIRVHLGTRKLKIRQENLLSVFWGGGLDTTCSICGNIFDKERGSLIRTISLEGTASPPKDLTKSSPIYRPIRVHNRHLQCIKNSNIEFIPVSHVWHEAVALAHSSKQPNVEAAALVYQIPLRTLMAVAGKYGQMVEIWHDYVSIPQWQYEVQQRLLLLLPAIFAANQASVVHLDDRSATDLVGLDNNISEPSQLLVRYFHFLGARWFKRMWVVLEYASSKHLDTLSREFVLLDLSFKELWSTADGLKTRAYVALGYQTYLESCRKAQGALQLRVRNVHEYSYSFGTAIDAISERECREYRDRAVAICGFFPVWTYENIIAKLPDDPVQACLWVARKCLENGDYTPLLLSYQSENEVPEARWLACHEHMSSQSWFWGDTLMPAKNKPVIESGKVKVEVELVGTAERNLEMRLPKSDILAFEYLIREVIKVTGTCASTFVSSIGRLYGMAEFVRSPPESLGSEATINLDAISAKLDSYIARNGEESYLQRDIIQEIFDMLHLSVAHSYGITFGNFAWASNLEQGEQLLFVRCKSCQILSIFRANIWREFPPGTQLYRIPGLEFENSLADGVGIAVSGNRIIGIMMWGTPACDCHKLEMIVIE